MTLKKCCTVQNLKIKIKTSLEMMDDLNIAGDQSFLNLSDSQKDTSVVLWLLLLTNIISLGFTVEFCFVSTVYYVIKLCILDNVRTLT